MKINITINADNAAFEEGGLEAEVARILGELARRLNDGLVNMQLERRMGRAPLLLRDINGNIVGALEVEEDA